MGLYEEAILLTNVSLPRGHVRLQNAARRYGSLRAKDIANSRAFGVIRATPSVTIFSYPAPSTHRPEPHGPNSPKVLSKKAISSSDVADVHSMLDSRVPITGHFAHIDLADRRAYDVQ